VWDKVKIGMGYHYRARYEFILFFEKGKRKLNDLGVPDIIQVPRVYRGYPTEKPYEVSEILINQSTEPNDIVIDPFMGSGSTGIASVKLGRNFIGNDIGSEALKVARDRLQDLQIDFVSTFWPKQT
jgi:site-specific DNA-methyltransferase (adenine-specific)